MLDVCLVGTGGMMPLPRRWLTALMTRYNGSSLLIDCGEGTQVAIKEKGWSFKPIDVICFTHYHGDHISGLPGRPSKQTVLPIHRRWYLDLREKESGLLIQQIPDQQNLSCEMQRNRICLSVKECTEKMTKQTKHADTSI